MRRALAFEDDSPAAAHVHDAATAMAVWTKAELEVVRAPEDSVIPTLLTTLQQPGVRFAVLGSRSLEAKPELAGHVAMALLAESPVPLVIVPPGGFKPPTGTPLFLVPLDGVADTDEAVLSVGSLLIGHGADLLGLHVYDAASVPPFVGSAEDIDALAREFLARHVPSHRGRCLVRIGNPDQQILAVAAEETVDAIVVAWHQDLSPGKADVVRRLLRESPVPLVMVPIRRASDQTPPGP